MDDMLTLFPWWTTMHMAILSREHTPLETHQTPNPMADLWIKDHLATHQIQDAMGIAAL